ncbi:hypothetical protein [Brevundimonas sp.]|uniref:hypothetical protein n=1 Tax=Brevundimonas sp. TaxID=1871086 RepID=UPI001DEF0C61|nr:hypothetical protein [Brevundimonas sp.]MBA4000414.1 hypothetical protein [Brevundimonas sp.]
MALTDMIPRMSDAELKVLRTNASRLLEHGLPAQKIAASDIMPQIDGEIESRQDAAPPKKTPAPRKKKAVVVSDAA